MNTTGKGARFPQPAGMVATIPFREALKQGITTGNFIDTKIVLYSYRDSSGRVCRPKALYANSHVLKTIRYFNDCEYTTTLGTARAVPHGITSQVLFGDFAEAQSRNFREVVDETEFAEDYGYLSDSDLEDEGDEPEGKNPTEPAVDPSEPSTVSVGGEIDHGYHEERIEKGKVVKIPDVAFIT